MYDIERYIFICYLTIIRQICTVSLFLIITNRDNKCNFVCIYVPFLEISVVIGVRSQIFLVRFLVFLVAFFFLYKQPVKLDYAPNGLF